jgi:nitrate reductase delta subunit
VMAQTFKVLSALLSYPTEELQEAADELRAALRDEALLPQATQADVDRLIVDLAAGDLYALQERYVELFDRGQAMIDLKALYEKHGLLSASSELPDFLPLFLEFLSILPVEEAREQLGQIAHITAMLGERLRKRDAPYGVVFQALVDLALAPTVSEEGMAVSAVEDEALIDLAALDAQWEDTPVTFGPEVAPNCRDQLFARIRAARRPAESLER